MASGHIRLGVPGSLRDYLLFNYQSRNKSLANPMAAKLGAGLGSYDDYMNYAGWLMESWEAGISKREADTGGTLYSELDTRFPNQVILPPYYSFNNISFTGGSYTHTAENLPVVGVTPLVVGAAGGAYTQVAFLFRINSPEDAIDRVFIPIYGGTGISVTAMIYSDISASPSLTTNPAAGSNWGSAAVVLDGELGLNYYSFNIQEQTITTGQYAWVILKPTTPGQTFTLPVWDRGASAYTQKKYNGSVWSDSQYFPFYYMVTYTGGDPLENIAKIEIYENKADSGATQTAWFIGTDYLSYYSGSEGVNSGKTVANAVDMCAFGDVLWIAKSSGADALTYTQSTDALATKTGIDAHMFARWGGLLWRAYQNDVWYTGDGSTWSGPFQIGPDGYEVTGMAGLGDDMYVSTDEGLYRVGAGNKVYGVTRWNQIDPNNGKGMIHHQGAIFIPVGLDLLQFNGSQVLPVGLNKEEGLPPYKQGRVVSLCSHNYWLIALVRAEDTTLGWSTVWAWNSQGWHYVASLPRRVTGNGLAWDVTHNCLWVGAGATPMKIYLPKNAENPYRDASGTAKFNQSGYMETGWFYGQLKEIQKDWESVYIAGENITSARYVDVYYQDDASTDWEYLGRVTSNRQELRWSDYSTRPASRQLKIAVALATDDYAETPVVNAIRVKYMPMVMDRWRWSLPITVADALQMLDGTISSYTAAQMVTHLDALIKQVPPFIYEDVDGLQYEVKVLNASEALQQYERPSSGVNRLKSVYNITIEQTQTGTYSA